MASRGAGTALAHFVDAVRHRLGLRQGDRVAFDVGDGSATLHPLRAEPDAFDAHALERADRLLNLDPRHDRSAFGDLRIEP